MKRTEVLLDEQVLAALDKIAADAATNRSFLIRKAIRLYLENRKQREQWELAPDWHEQSS